MTEPLTLAQRLREQRSMSMFVRKDDMIRALFAERIEAADEIDAKDATIASLRDANKALTVERDEARRLVDGIDEERRGALDLCLKLNGDVAGLSAELAEARRVIVKSDEDLRSIHLHIEEHSFPRANGIISQALSRTRSFLASKEASHAS